MRYQALQSTGLAAALLVMWSWAPSAQATTIRMPSGTTEDFCLDVQRGLAPSTIPASNVVHASYEDFKKSKPDVSPLTVHQFLLRDPNDESLVIRVSCKTKTPDHLRAAYGDDTAQGSARSCRDIHRALVMSVWGAMSPQERASATHRPTTILLDGDVNSMMGSHWITDYDAAYLDSEGTLHLFAKALRVDWDDIWFAWAPDSLRGVHYCHLVAPEHLRRLMLGDVSAPASGSHR